MAFSPEHSTSRCIYGHHSRAVVGIPRLNCTAATSIHSRSPATVGRDPNCRFGLLGMNRFSRTEPHIPYTLFRRALSAEPRANRDILGRASKLPPSSLGPETQRAREQAPWLLCENFSRSSDRNDLFAGESAHALTPPIDCDLLFCVCFN